MTLLRRMPLIFLVGTAAPALLSVWARISPSIAAGVDSAKQIASVDIFVAALIVTFWTAVLTVSIACLIVFVMKGPAYVADAYPLNDAPRPGTHRSDR